jgi:DNA-binding MarR family transcriptional regulator
LRRALVSLPNGVWKIIDKELKGKIGDGDSEVIRNLVITHLTEKGYLLPTKNQPSQVGQIADEVEMQDAMVNALLEILEEKGLLKYSDWEARLKKNLSKRTASQ